MNEEKRSELEYALELSSVSKDVINDLTDSLDSLFTAIVKLDPERALTMLREFNDILTKEWVEEYRKERTKVADTLASFYLNTEK